MNPLGFRDIWIFVWAHGWGTPDATASGMLVVHQRFFRKSRPTSGGCNFCATCRIHVKPFAYESIDLKLSFDIKIMSVRWKLIALEIFLLKFEHIFPLHEGMCTCGHAPHGPPRWSTSGGCNFYASGRNCMKPPPNESSEFIFSFGGGFMQFPPLARKLRPPEVGLDFRKNPLVRDQYPRHEDQKI